MEVVDLYILHKKCVHKLVIVNIFDRLSKNEIFLKKMLDFLFWICYNRQAVLRKTHKTCSLKIEQHEISSTEKCEISLKKHFEKRNSKSKKSQEKNFSEKLIIKSFGIL